MKEQYIRDLCEGSKVDSLFALRSRDLRSARTGEPYLSLELGDRSGRIPAVMFRPGSVEEALPIGSVVRLRGLVTTFRNVRRVTVEALRPAGAFEPADFLAAGTRDREEMLTELRALVRLVRDARLRSVVRAVFGAPGFIDRFSACPASVGRHHAYVGGLLEHTVAVANLCVMLAGAYPQADADLLLAAALLHDVGKTEELSSDTSFELTEAGHLVGHVVLGERIISRALGSLARPVDPGVAVRLTHAVLSHHGEQEWGAPRCPCTIEALLLHHADHTDAQSAAFLEAVSGAAVLQQGWSDRNNSFGRALMVPSGPVGVPSALPAAARRVCA
jgi:3'-5' exoribonuclease